MIPKRFLAELKRRHVYNVAVGYIVIAWSLIQVLTQVAPLFDVPRAVERLIVLLVVFVGFPLAVGLAWVFDVTPQGIRRTEDVVLDDSVSNEPVSHGDSQTAG